MARLPLRRRVEAVHGAAPSPGDPQTRAIARRVLVHLVETPLALEQQQFIASGPVAALRDELQPWAAEPIRLGTLLADIERYERTNLQSDARRLAFDCQYLSVSPSEGERRLAGHIEVHYRNANLRIAVTEELINALIPERNLEYARVNKTVLGRPVWGESLMATELAVQLEPDPKHVRLAMKVTGEIAALTTVDAGAAKFLSDSKSYYVARKPLEIDMNGISLYPVEIEVHNNTQLRGVQTSLDPIPFVSVLGRGMAKWQYEQNKPAADAELKEKVASEATERIDSEMRKQLSGVVERANRRVFDPLNSLMLDPQLIDAETNQLRFTMRLRLAGDDQLGSHTPRPQAPSDSLLSLQMHESVLNNGIQRLELAGHACTLPELSKHVAKRLHCPAAWPTNPENDDVRIVFAERDPIVVHCQDGRLVLTLSIAQLSKPSQSRKWRNFQIRVFLKPEIHERSAELVRDGVIHLIGRQPTGSQFALRGIFSLAFSKKNPWQLVPERLLNEPKLKDAEITQFVIDDGWIGLRSAQAAGAGDRPQAATAQRREVTFLWRRRPACLEIAGETPAPQRLLIFLEQRIDERARLEQGEVFGLLADADVLDRQANLLANRHDHAAAGRAVELGQNQPGALHRVGEMPGLADAVLAGRGVEHQKHLVRRLGNLLAQHAMDFRELLHQIVLRLQPPGRIDDAYVGADFHGAGDGAMGHGGRIAARRAGDDFRPEPLGPNGQLLDGGGAEGVGRAEHDLFALRLEHRGQFGDRRSFAAAVDARHHDNGRSAFGETDRRGGLRQQNVEHPLDLGDGLVHFDDPCAELLADVVGDFLRGVDAHVDLHQPFKQIVAERFVNQPPLRLEQVADVGAQQLFGLFETLCEFVE